MSVQPARGRSVARFLRSHSGIASVQAPEGNRYSRLVLPEPYLIEVVATRSQQYQRTRVNLLSQSSSLWFVVNPSIGGDTVADSQVTTDLRVLAAMMKGHYADSQGAYEDQEGR